MRYIEAEGITLAHISGDEEPKAPLCGMSSFPWDWHQPVKRTKAVCRSCLTNLRGGSSRR